MYADKKETIFMWVSGHTGIQGNKAAYRAAKEAFKVKVQGF